MKSLNIRGEWEKTARNTLQTLNPNVCLTRLNVDCELTKAGSGVSVGRVTTESPLRRKLLTLRALNATRQPSCHDDGNMATKSKRHSALKSSSSRPNCRCFGRPMICSICLTRYVLSIHN